MMLTSYKACSCRQEGCCYHFSCRIRLPCRRRRHCQLNERDHATTTKYRMRDVNDDKFSASNQVFAQSSGSLPMTKRRRRRRSCCCCHFVYY